MSVSRGTSERLKIYCDLLLRWNKRINLVAPGSLSELQDRHIDDCLQLADLVSSDSGNWVDLGSGGGLPGMVLAIANAHVGIGFTLVESDQRKAAFLRAAIRETGLEKVSVLIKRIEALHPLNADYLSARALAPLPQLMAYLDLHLAPTGTAFLMKGRQWQAEVQDAKREWTFDYVAHPSRTQAGAATLEIRGVSHGAR